MIEKPPGHSNFVLCAPSIIKTPNFLKSLSRGPTVVSTKFLDHCIEHQEFPDVENFLLQDKDGEKKLLDGAQLVDAVERARYNNRKLLKGTQIFSTLKSDVGSTFNSFREIIQSNGGDLLPFDTKSKFALPKSQLKGAGGQEVFLLVPEDVRDKKLLEKFNNMATDNGLKPRIVKKDWLFTTVLRQELIEVKKEWLLRV